MNSEARPSSFRSSIFGPTLPSARHRPSSWSLTTMTAFSTPRLQACCILLPVLRFIAFGRPFGSASLESDASLLGRFPATQDPSELFPRWQPSPRHRGCCLLAVAVGQLSLVRSELRFRNPYARAVSDLGRLQGFAPSASPLRPPTVSDRKAPDALLGFVAPPLRVRPPCGFLLLGFIEAMSTSKNGPRCLLG